MEINPTDVVKVSRRKSMTLKHFNKFVVASTILLMNQFASAMEPVSIESEVALISQKVFQAHRFQIHTLHTGQSKTFALSVVRCGEKSETTYIDQNGMIVDKEKQDSSSSAAAVFCVGNNYQKESYRQKIDRYFLSRKMKIAYLFPEEALVLGSSTVACRWDHQRTFVNGAMVTANRDDKLYYTASGGLTSKSAPNAAVAVYCADPSWYGGVSESILAARKDFSISPIADVTDARQRFECWVLQGLTETEVIGKELIIYDYAQNGAKVLRKIYTYDQLDKGINPNKICDALDEQSKCSCRSKSK